MAFGGVFCVIAGIRFHIVTRTLIAVTIVAWPIAAELWIYSRAAAAEVDAVGAPAPVGFAAIVERVKPAVVGVRVKVEGGVQPNDAQQRNPIPPGFPSEGPVSRFDTVLGSGFFISGDGYVVTNNHVVANGLAFEVTVENGETYDAKVIGADPQTDLALIKVTANVDFPYVRLAAAEANIGDWVLAVGNPFGLGGTVTAGIVSARGRDIGAGPYDEFIQIDAPVNQGNSGGPTFNVRGEVVGVNTAIFSPSGGSVGIAFDIPAETVKLIVRQLREKGHVTRGWIGIQIQSVTPAIADAIGMKDAQGGLVAQVEPNSPARNDGVEIGDVITSVNGETVKDWPDLARKIAAIAPGTSIKIGVFRNGQNKTLTVTVGALPEAVEQKPASEATILGLILAPASVVAGAGDQGVVITGIDPAGPASDSGLQTGDVILDVGRRAINTPADVRNIVDDARKQSKRAVLLRVKRGDIIKFVAVPIA